MDYILETFPIVRRKDEAKHGNYRTKLEILDLYDQMERLGLRLEEFRSRLGDVGVGRVVEAVVADAPALPKRSEFNPVFDQALELYTPEYPELAGSALQRSIFLNSSFHTDPRKPEDWLPIIKRKLKR